MNASSYRRGAHEVRRRHAKDRANFGPSMTIRRAGVQNKTNGYGRADIALVAFPDDPLMLPRGRDRGDASVADGEIN